MKGFIVNFNGLDAQNTTVEIKGLLTIHGVEKEMSAMAKIEVLKNRINLSGTFKVEVADFNINIPTIVRNNIAKTIKVTFDLKHKPYK